MPSFEFNAEFGGISDPFQLKDGTYRVKVQIKVGKKTKTKIVRVIMDDAPSRRMSLWRSDRVAENTGRPRGITRGRPSFFSAPNSQLPRPPARRAYSRAAVV